MKNHFLGMLAFGAVLCTPAFALAHQPQIVDTSGSIVTIENPEVSKAYYGRLQGEPQIFEITSKNPFTLYMRVLVPDVPGAKRDVSAALIDPKHMETAVAVLDGAAGPWSPLHENFAQDDYFAGPEFRAGIPGGTYQIAVWSSNNDSAYTLVVGEKESFGIGALVQAYRTVPVIKSSFFQQPSLIAYFTPILGGPILLLIVLIAATILWRLKK